MTAWYLNVFTDTAEDMQILGLGYRERTYRWNGDTVKYYESKTNFGPFPEDRDECHKKAREVQAKVKRYGLKGVEVEAQEEQDPSYTPVFD